MSVPLAVGLVVLYGSMLFGWWMTATRARRLEMGLREIRESHDELLEKYRYTRQAQNQLAVANVDLRHRCDALEHQLDKARERAFTVIDGGQP